MVSIRPARPQDAAEIAAVHVATWQAAYRGLIADDFLDSLDPAVTAARWQSLLSDPDRSRRGNLVAVEDDHVLGFSGFGSSRDADAPDHGEIYSLYVDAGRWGTGVGRMLISAARAELCGLGHHQAILWVLEGNERAHSFYRADRWRPDGSGRIGEFGGVSAGELRYRRRL